MNGNFLLSSEQKKAACENIKIFFFEKRDEEISDLVALLLLDFICEKFGPYFYNIGVHDAGLFISGSRV